MKEITYDSPSFSAANQPIRSSSLEHAVAIGGKLSFINR